MDMKTTRIAALLLAALGCGAGTAQTVYRCGNYYSQKPCAGATEIDTSDPRTPAQAAEAAAAAKRSARAADTMEKDRLAQEKRAAPPVIIANSPRAAAASEPAQPHVIKGKQPKEGGKGGKHATAATAKEPAGAGAKPETKKDGKKPKS